MSDKSLMVRSFRSRCWLHLVQMLEPCSDPEKPQAVCNNKVGRVNCNVSRTSNPQNPILIIKAPISLNPL